MVSGKGLAGCNQFIQGLQSRFVVIAQASRVIKIDMGQLRTLFANLDELVHLLLVFGKSKTHFGIIERKHALGGCCVLVQGNGHGTERLHRQHGGIQARPVGTDHHHVVMLAQSGLVQAARQMLNQGGHGTPVDGLPDAVFFLAHGGALGSLAGMVEQKLRKSRLHESTVLFIAWQARMAWRLQVGGDDRA
ncbi:hypothetical protein GALL_498040 [mine drainage metagenome]|uniref:Uncharacterized protein n=1 Tax=mine drainage metagenome TaxID=410659 RepID=A0A1J5PBM3_9ZZZZ